MYKFYAHHFYFTNDSKNVVIIKDKKPIFLNLENKEIKTFKANDYATRFETNFIRTKDNRFILINHKDLSMIDSQGNELYSQKYSVDILSVLSTDENWNIFQFYSEDTILFWDLDKKQNNKKIFQKNTYWHVTNINEEKHFF